MDKQYPLIDPGERKRVANNDECPECGGELDTGWEWNKGGEDARHRAETEREKAREKRK